MSSPTHSPVASSRVRGRRGTVCGGGSHGEDSVSELTRLGDMREQGLITDDEFARAKARALA